MAGSHNVLPMLRSSREIGNSCCGQHNAYNARGFLDPGLNAEACGTRWVTRQCGQDCSAMIMNETASNLPSRCVR